MRIKNFDKGSDGMGIVIEDENGISQIYLKSGGSYLQHVGMSDKPFDDVDEYDVDECIANDEIKLDYFPEDSDITFYTTVPNVGDYYNDDERRQVEDIIYEWRQLHENFRNSEAIFRKRIEEQIKQFSERAKWDLNEILLVIIDPDNNL